MDLPAIRQSLPRELASFDREQPLCLLFFCREDRPRLGAVDAGALLAKSPSGGFCKVAATEAVDVYVESPALAMVRVAQELNACVRKRQLSWRRRSSALRPWVAEFCGLYSRDAADPIDGEVTWGTEPATTSAELCRVANASPAEGLRLA